MEALKYSVCVKKCPTKTSQVECYKTRFMYQKPNSYKDCVYYPYGVVSNDPFRYGTALFAGKFCVPDP